MNAFTFERLSRQTDAASAVAAHPGAMFLAGGTTLVDATRRRSSSGPPSRFGLFFFVIG